MATRRVNELMLEIAEAVPRTVRASDDRLTGYYEYGDPNGTPVVALHGTPACGAGFAWADRRARTRGIRLLAPDRPGIGDSDPWDPGPDATVDRYPPRLSAFAEKNGQFTYDIVNQRFQGELHEVNGRLVAREFRKRQQGTCQGNESPHLLKIINDRVAIFLGSSGFKERDLQIPLQYGQGCSQLVSGMIDESPLTFHVSLEPVHHGIKRLGQLKQLPIG